MKISHIKKCHTNSSIKNHQSTKKRWLTQQRSYKMFNFQIQKREQIQSESIPQFIIIPILTNHYNYQQKIVLGNNHKRLGCLIVIQITRFIMDNDTIKRYINNILISNIQTRNLKKKRDKIDILCGIQKSKVSSKQTINKKFQ